MDRNKIITVVFLSLTLLTVGPGIFVYAGIRQGSTSFSCSNVSPGQGCGLKYLNVYYSLNPYLVSTSPSNSKICVGYLDLNTGSGLCKVDVGSGTGENWSCSTCPGSVESVYLNVGSVTVNLNAKDTYLYCSAQPCPTKPSG